MDRVDYILKDIELFIEKSELEDSRLFLESNGLIDFLKNVTSNINKTFNDLKVKISKIQTDQDKEKCKQIIEQKIDQKVLIPKYSEWEKLASLSFKYNKMIYKALSDMTPDNIDNVGKTLKGYKKDFEGYCKTWTENIQNNLYCSYGSSLVLVKNIDEFNKKYEPILNRYRGESLKAIKEVSNLYNHSLFDNNIDPIEKYRMNKMYQSGMKMIKYISDHILYIFAKYPVSLFRAVGSVSTTRTVNESAESGLGYFHITTKKPVNGGLVVKPCIPNTFMTKHGFEDGHIKRVCVASDVDRCLMSLGKNLKSKILYVYQSKYDVETYEPTVDQVPDVNITHEKWILSETEFEYVGKIKVEGAINIPYIYQYGTNEASLYKWKWNWIERI